MRKIKDNTKNRLMMKKLSITLACVGIIGYNSMVSAKEVNVNSGEETYGNNITVNDDEYIINDESLLNSSAINMVYGGGDENNETSIENNNIHINGSSVYGILGGISSIGDVANNSIFINGGTVSNVAGGFTFSNYEDTTAVAGNVFNNHIYVNGGTVENVSGGEVGFMSPISVSTPSDFSQWYSVNGGNVTGNTVDINGGTVGNVIGGVALTGNAANNTINIRGGKITGKVIGGMIRYYINDTSSAVTGNTINVYADNNPDLSDAQLIGGSISSNSNSSQIYGNTLTFHNISNITASSINNFDNINFIISESAKNNSNPLLTLTGGRTTFANETQLNVNAVGGSNLQEGDTINIMSNSSGIDVNNLKNNGVISEGVSLNYKLLMPSINGTTSSSSLSDEGDLTNVTATVGGLIGLNPEIKITSMPPVNMINNFQNHTNKTMDDLIPESDKEIDEQEINIHNEVRPFFNTSYSSLRTKTGNGSFVRSKSGGIDFGFAKTITSASGNDLIIAPIFDYGTGKYDAYLSSGAHGNGDTKFYAGGIILRKLNKKSGFYYEGSARVGHARSDFESGDFKRGDVPEYSSFEVSAPIISGHINLGKIIPINRENTFQVYGQYFHTHQNGTNADLSSGEHYVFDSVDSGRFRTGFRLVRQPNKRNRFYSGLAYQYEFNGDSSGVYNGHRTSEASIKGSSGMLELGWQIKPTKGSPIMLDLGAVGWIGYQKGITCHAKFKKAF